MLDLVRGTKDLFGINLLKHKKIIQSAEDLSKRFNFHELQTPIIEKAGLFAKALDDETDIMNKEIYSFKDKGDELIALRPEFTACIMRHVIHNPNHLLKKPHKIFSYGPLFRYDRPQAGRQRQFSQINFEVLGASSMLYDAELILLAKKILSALKISDYQIHINYLGGPIAKEKYERLLFEYFSLHKSKLSESSSSKLDKNPLRILDSKDLNDQDIIKDAPGIDQVLSNRDIEIFEEFKYFLDHLGIKYIWNKQMVRGLNYYTGTIFEFVTEKIGAQSAILGGGRYDTLYENMGGKNPYTVNQGENTILPAVGFAAGIERLSLLMDDICHVKRNLICIASISFNENANSLKIAEILRTNICNSSVEILSFNGNMKKKLEMAAKIDSDYIIFIGEDEIASQVFSLRNMHTKEVHKLDMQGIIDFFN